MTSLPVIILLRRAFLAPPRSKYCPWLALLHRYMISERLKGDNSHIHRYLVPAFLWDIALGAVITRLFPIAFLLSPVAFCAGKQATVAFAGTAAFSGCIWLVFHL
jgi:hypothetical protein